MVKPVEGSSGLGETANIMPCTPIVAKTIAAAQTALTQISNTHHSMSDHQISDLDSLADRLLRDVSGGKPIAESTYRYAAGILSDPAKQLDADDLKKLRAARETIEFFLNPGTIIPEKLRDSDAVTVFSALLSLTVAGSRDPSQAELCANKFAQIVSEYPNGPLAEILMEQALQNVTDSESFQHVLGQSLS